MNKELFVFGKNVKDISKGGKEGWKDKDNKNIFSRLAGAVKGATAPVKISNPLIESDKKAMVEYNKVLSQTSYTQLELDSTLKSSTETAKMYAQSFNGAAVDVDGYTGTIKSATFASKALAVASVALNMALAAGVGFAISKIMEYSQAQKQAAEDDRRNADENSKASQEELKGLNDLIKEYKTLASQTDLTEDNKARLLEIQNKLIDTFGLEAEGIDLVNKKYDEQIDKIEKLRGEVLEEAVQTAQADYNVKSSDTSYADHRGNFFGQGDVVAKGSNWSLTSQSYADDYEYILKYMKETYNASPSQGQLSLGKTLTLDSGKIRKQLGEYEVEDLITDLDNAIELLEKGGQKSGDLYTGLVNYRKEQQGILDLYNDSKSVLAQTTFDLYSLNNPIEKVTTETYKDWHDKLLLLAGQDEALKKDLIELSTELFPDKDYQFELMTPKQREDAYKQSKLNGTYDESSNVNKVLPEAVKTVTEELEDESISLKRVNQLLQLKNLTDEEQNSLLEKQAELLESTESQISSLNGAIETLANGNKLSADEIYDLIQLYPELATNVKSLGDGYIIENDALKLVRDAHIDTALSTREAQLQTTFNVLEETANRIGLYKDEITAIQSVADAQNLLAKINEDNANRRPSSINSMADYEAFKNQGSPSNEVKNQLEDYISQREALELLQNELYGKLGTSGDGSGSGSGSGGSGSDPYLKAFEDSKKELDHLRKMDVYDDWQYYLELEKLSDSYFKGKMDYLDEYYQYSSEVYTSLKDLYKKTLEEEKSKLQEVNAEEERKLSLKKAYDNYMKAQNDKMKVYYEDRGFIDEANKNDVETARLELQKQITAQKVSEIDNKIKNLDDVPNNYYTNPKTGSNVPPSFLKPLTQADLDSLISASPALNTITKNFDLTGALFNPDAMNQVQNVTNTDNKRVVVNLSIDKIITENPEDFANQMSDIVSNKFLEILDGTLLQSENR